MLECNTKTMLRENPWLPPSNTECVPQRDTPLWIVSLDPHGCTNTKCFVLSFCQRFFYCSVALSVFLLHLFYIYCFIIVIFVSIIFLLNCSMNCVICLFASIYQSLYYIQCYFLLSYFLSIVLLSL